MPKLLGRPSYWQFSQKPRLKTLFFTAGPKYSWKRALSLIVLSVVSVYSLVFCGNYIRIGAKKFQCGKRANRIKGIVQKRNQLDLHAHLMLAFLPVGYLSEVLDLSIDQPKNFTEFDLAEARNKLLATHFIEKVQIKKIQHSLLFIDYQVRKPWAFLQDYTNTVIDPQGYYFPFYPFYSPRHLPKIYLGEDAPKLPWGETMKKELLVLAHQIKNSLKEEKIETIDLSHAAAPSAGQREIVITLKNGIILRLSPKNCVQQLTHYSILKAKKNDYMGIIDLRIPEIAYLQRINW